FAELYRKTRQLEQLNQELERRVAERTAELEASTVRLLKSEERRSLALAAGQMGSWEWDPVDGRFVWDDGQYRIFGVDPASFDLTVDNVRALIHPEDWKHLQNAIKPAAPNSRASLAKNSPHSAPTARSGSRLPVLRYRSSRARRRRSPSPCTNSPRTRPNTARCRSRQAGWR